MEQLVSSVCVVRSCSLHCSKYSSLQRPVISIASESTVIIMTTTPQKCSRRRRPLRLSWLAVVWTTTAAAITGGDLQFCCSFGFAPFAPWTRSRRVFVAEQRRRFLSPTFLLHAFYSDSNADVIFGSANQTAGSVSYGELDDDDIDDDDANDSRRSAYRQRVQELLQESDEEFRKQRKAQQWGQFANASSAQEIQTILQEQLQRIQAENAIQAQHAAASGVEFQFLEPKEYDSSGSGIGGVFEDSGNVRISAGSAKGGSWFAEMDEELKDEWKALTMGDASPNYYDDNEDVDGDEGNAAGDLDVKLDEASGKIVPREALAGVRVGSAGGWTLEVFPGDFVVHRKFGIGRFERTCLRPKTKLTKAELKARDERRAEILTRELRKKKGGVTPEQIQAIRSKFGTEEDTDPVSNPQTTVLEISYADAVVHVPVDRAYRLSRYRAGDAVVKPKLSRARSEAWTTAKRRAEENTLELAQDVLALYATRETLNRPPFDPVVEVKVKEFEKSFPFTPTIDQIKCFEDVENDMVWRSRPMDRLVCGDVGFGKTEVAIRALYRAVANGRQAAMLAPTGVLASQHYKNIMKRMGPGTPHNVTITLLRRGMSKTTKSGQMLREQIGSGEIQLIVGTHSLLSNDVKYKNLGLLVVDEEQRFGVRQKERLKLICDGIDVLTLSAT